MANLYGHASAAALIGASKNSILRWGKRARAVQERKAQGVPIGPEDQIWLDFPMPRRLARSGHRVFSDEDVARMKDWRLRLATPPIV